MSENEKHQKGFSQADIADELQAAADDLARGQLRIGRHAVAVGEPIYLKMSSKLKGDMAYFTLSLKMPIAKKQDAAAGRPPSPGEGEAAKPGRKPPRSQTEGGYGGRKLKKEIGQFWKSVSKRIEAEQMPDAAETEGLLKRCEEYNLFASEEWQADWADCTLAVQKCFTDAATGDWPAAKADVARVNRMIRDCHDKYK